MFRVIKPPAPLELRDHERTVFLAGSIEMGTAEDWQQRVSDSLCSRDVTVLNPRRDQWDASWEQSINHVMFRQQVEWELSAQELATVIAMYFDPATKAPITLLELGLFARADKVIVCCPDGFWRKGNVDIVCARYDIPLADSLDQLIDQVQTRLDV